MANPESQNIFLDPRSVQEELAAYTLMLKMTDPTVKVLHATQPKAIRTPEQVFPLELVEALPLGELMLHQTVAAEPLRLAS